jgi:hypothetical protein
MTIPGHFLLGEMFTPDTFLFEDDHDPWGLFNQRMTIPRHFYLERDVYPGTFPWRLKATWGLFTWGMTIPWHFLLGEMFNLWYFSLGG